MWWQMIKTAEAIYYIVSVSVETDFFKNTG